MAYVARLEFSFSLWQPYVISLDLAGSYSVLDHTY